MDDVGSFFDREAHEYHGDYLREDRAGMAAFHSWTARHLEAELEGSVLTVGGLWLEADLKQRRYPITVVDVSPAMLERYQDQGLNVLCCDARRLAVASNSFDHVVLPLVLHHVTGRSAWSARRNVAAILREMHRVLKQGGRIWISDFAVNRVVYGVEILAGALTRCLLALADIPLVVMHSKAFYLCMLRESGFCSLRVMRPKAATAKCGDWIQPVIGLPWLRVPRFVALTHPILISARCA